MPLPLIAPVAGLPVGPATEATVRAQLNVQDNIDDVSLALAINAANVGAVKFRYVDEWVQAHAEDDPAPEAWPFDLAQGVTLLAVRLFRRRNSSEGVISFTDQGAVYVQRNDPDIALLLKLGGNARPAVG